MLSQKSTMKTKLENMYLQKRISYGYRKVINMMLCKNRYKEYQE